jgi:uncharacterized protein (DUF2252 family)
MFTSGFRDPLSRANAHHLAVLADVQHHQADQVTVGDELIATAGRAHTGPLVLDPGRLAFDERAALGKQARTVAPRGGHGEFGVTSSRADPIDLLEEQAKTRVPELVPIRHGRMLVSPFTYYRGAALPMAADLAASPNSGIDVQICGDAHLSNFGLFASPERHLFFDVNDFDETARGPWEWDVKRLAASLEVAGREHDFSEARRRTIVRTSVRAYREAMRHFATLPILDVWYARLDVDELLPRFQALLDPKRTPSVWKAIAKARARDSLQAYEKLCRVVDGEPRINHDPPLIVPIELHSGVDARAVSELVQHIILGYLNTLEPARKELVQQYRVAHIARKVVGVGSVGTEAWIVLLLDHASGAPLLLQVKEAEESVVERFTTQSRFDNRGRRVVAGQRAMQAASDIFLGWNRFEWSGSVRDYYVRQLRDWKGSADIAGMTAAGMELWAEMCGWTLARAHARSGDRVAIAAYLGRSDTFDRAIAKFADAYADQNERDYLAFKDAVVRGRMVATTGV